MGGADEMLELFTERGRRVIALARDLAAVQADPAMGVQHLLAAALRVDGGDIARSALGVSEAQAQQILTRYADDTRVTVPSSSQPTPEAKRVMGGAALQAREADSRADVGHLLVQLLTTDDADLDRMLTALGVDREDAYRRAQERSAADERRPQARLQGRVD